MREEADKVHIYVWADGTWCYAEDIGDFNHKSDDYASVACHVGDEEEAVAAFNRI